MLFRLFKKFYRAVGLLVVIVLLTAYLKTNYPSIGKTVGSWISGLGDSRVAQAFSAMLENLSEGNGLTSSVEVFYDNLQESSPS